MMYDRRLDKTVNVGSTWVTIDKHGHVVSTSTDRALCAKAAVAVYRAIYDPDMDPKDVWRNMRKEHGIILIEVDMLAFWKDVRHLNVQGDVPELFPQQVQADD